MKKSFLLALPLLAMSLGAHAVPAKRMVYTMKQSDGTTVQVYKHGERFCAYYTTLDGKVLYSNPDANYDLCYANVVDGKVVPSNIVAHEIADRTQAELDFLSTCTINSASPEVVELSDVRKVHYASTTDGLGKYGTSALGSVNSIGTPRIPVILVNYADVKLQSYSTTELYQRILSEEGYTDNSGSVGSVRDYFADNSKGMFTPDFQVVGTVTLSKDRSYYGANRGGSNGGDVRAVDMVVEAIELAAKQGVDFTQFERNGNVENVIVIYAGMGEASGGSPETIWPHEYDFAKDVNGIHFNSYFVGNELNSSGTTDGIGTLVHEFSHALGLPDLYVTNYSYDNDSGFGYFSVMDTGCYSGGGYRPVGYTAYEKSYLGWLDIPSIVDPAAVTLENPGTSDKNIAVRVNNPYSTTEYFILENRMPDKWFLSNNVGGLMETHIAYNRSQWQSNTLNNTQAKKRAHIITADKSVISYTVSPDMLYGNGINNITRMPLYSGSNLDGYDVYRILRHSDGTMTFNFKQRELSDEYKPTAGNRFKLVTSVEDLNTGDSVIVVNPDAGFAVGTMARNGAYNLAAINAEGSDAVLADADAQVFYVRKNTNNWAFKTGLSSYLSVSRDGLTSASSLTNGRFNLVISGNGDATITFTANYDNNCLNIDNDQYYANVVASNPSKLRIYKQNTTSGIDGVHAGDAQQTVREVYNLQGQRVNSTGKLPKGIYVINGKKTVVK